MRISDWSSDVCSSDLGHSHPAPCRSADETLSPQSGEEPKKATRAALSSTARVANVPFGRRARSSGASGSRPPVPAVRGGTGDERSLIGPRRTLSPRPPPCPPAWHLVHHRTTRGHGHFRTLPGHRHSRRAERVAERWCEIGWVSWSGGYI